MPTASTIVGEELLPIPMCRGEGTARQSEWEKGEKAHGWKCHVDSIIEIFSLCLARPPRSLGWRPAVG